LLTPRSTPHAGEPPLLAVLGCLYNIFAATLHIESLSSIRNLRTRHAVVTGTRVSQSLINKHGGEELLLHTFLTSTLDAG